MLVQVNICTLEEIQSTSQSRFARIQPVVAIRVATVNRSSISVFRNRSRKWTLVYQYVVSDSDKSFEMQSQLDCEQFQAQFELVSHPTNQGNGQGKPKFSLPRFQIPGGEQNRQGNP